MGEMCTRGRWIVAVAQCDPAGHEMEFCSVIFIGWERGVAHDLIGGLELTQIEQLAGENTALAPPFICVLERHGLGRGCQHQTGCVGKPIVTQHPMNAACLLYTSPSPRDGLLSRMPSSA